MKNNTYINQILITFIALVLLSMISGCSNSFSVVNTKTGSTQTAEILVPLPEGTQSGLELIIDFVGGELRLAPGADGFLAAGKATFNVADLKPIVEVSGSTYTLEAGGVEIKGLPLKDDFLNTWDLLLASSPMSLNINAGAYQGSFELGGLALENLAISEVGSDLTCTFSYPNKVEMSTFTYNTGASKVVLDGLANANFQQLAFTAGAGDYTLNFNGTLQRDASVAIDSGVGEVNIIIPEGVNAKLSFEGSLTAINLEDGWRKDGQVYTLSGSGPTITIMVKMRMGTLNLKNS